LSFYPDVCKQIEPVFLRLFGKRPNTQFVAKQSPADIETIAEIAPQCRVTAKRTSAACLTLQVGIILKIEGC
jgi:hypothetical protein